MRVNAALLVTLLGSLAAPAAGCGEDSGTNNYVPASSSSAPGAPPESLFSDTYRVGTDQTEAWALSSDLAAVRTAAGKYDWTAAEAGMAPGTRIAGAAAPAEQALLTGAVAKQNAPTALVAHGISLGKAAATEDDKKVAKQFVEKPLLVLSGLLAGRALDLGGAATIDSAAVAMFALEDKLAKRSDSEVPGIWGVGTSKITSDALAARTGELLMAARDAAAASDPLAPYHASRAKVYLTKYFFASTLNYAHEVESEVLGGKPTALHQTEGRLFAEGIASSFFGGDDAAAAPLRTVWQGPAAEIKLDGVRSALLDAYVLVADRAVSVIDASSSPAEGTAAAGALAGTADVLAEAIRAKGNDPAPLVSEAQVIATQLGANDFAGARNGAAKLRASLASVK